MRELLITPVFTTSFIYLFVQKEKQKVIRTSHIFVTKNRKLKVYQDTIESFNSSYCTLSDDRKVAMI